LQEKRLASWNCEQVMEIDIGFETISCERKKWITNNEAGKIENTRGKINSRRKSSIQQQRIRPKATGFRRKIKNHRPTKPTTRSQRNLTWAPIDQSSALKRNTRSRIASPKRKTITLID
jgi:hypothetical protein